MIERLARPVDLRSLGAFRILLGGLLLYAELRYLTSGWIPVHFGESSYFFKYLVAPWAPTWTPAGVSLHHGFLAVLACAILIGWRFRLCVALYCVGFTLAQFMDATNYLNHYYQVVLLTFLTAWMPLGHAYGLDGRRAGDQRLRHAPAWMLYILRFQVAVVYVHAAIAKIGSDWLLYGQPMDLWLASRTETPLIGWLNQFPWMPLAMSWGGFLFDATIIGWLMWSRSRPFAYLVVIIFHLMTHLLFNIGLFPWIMMITTTLFFAPDWPQRLAERIGGWKGDVLQDEAPPPRSKPRPLLWVALSCWILFQGLFPLRNLTVPGNVLWHEHGMRFSWRVMVREKNAGLDYRVKDRDSGRVWHVNPKRYLSWRQLGEMSCQPIMVVQMARHIAQEFARERKLDVAVYADVEASLNGRAPQALIDPEVDLTQVSLWSFDRSWILPGPETPPPSRWIAKK
ncbi:MAG TPA: gamma carboxylase [Myxococcales bacterium]|nr:gamma carboxylase [Myxococcales bacterium]